MFDSIKQDSKKKIIAFIIILIVGSIVAFSDLSVIDIVDKVSLLPIFLIANIYSPKHGMLRTRKDKELTPMIEYVMHSKNFVLVMLVLEIIITLIMYFVFKRVRGLEDYLAPVIILYYVSYVNSFDKR